MNNLVHAIQAIKGIAAIAQLAEEANGRAPYQVRERVNPFDLPDREFQGRYRFSKNGVQRLANLLRPQLQARDGQRNPFTVEQIVCCGLDYLGGGHFQRTEGVCSRSCTSSAFNMAYKFIDALLTHKDEFVRLPDRERRERNAREVLRKHHLFNVNYGIDGSHFTFKEKPR